MNLQLKYKKRELTKIQLSDCTITKIMSNKDKEFARLKDDISTLLFTLYFYHDQFEGGNSTIQEEQEFFKQQTKKFTYKDAGQCFYCLEYENAVIGVVHVMSKSSISSYIIKEGYRGRGIGRVFLQYVIDDLKKMLKGKPIYLGVVYDNTPALSLYQSLGFQAISLAMKKET